jgi:uncharacterized protein
MAGEFHIWIDNDGCPQRAREIVFKAAARNNVKVRVVANRYMHTTDPMIEMICVSGDFDAADDRIVEGVASGDLVVTGDVPLADRVVESGATAISPHGEIFTKESIKEKLALRNLRQELRGAGIMKGGGSAYDNKVVQRFANAFDRLLTQCLASRDER